MHHIAAPDFGRVAGLAADIYQRIGIAAGVHIVQDAF